jgi:hypothetical protein
MIREEMIINKLYDEVQKKMRSKNYTLDNLISETNLQQNINQSNVRTKMVEKVMQEMHDDLSIGFKTTEAQLDMLKTYSLVGGDSASKTAD